MGVARHTHTGKVGGAVAEVTALFCVDYLTQVRRQGDEEEGEAFILSLKEIEMTLVKQLG